MSTSRALAKRNSESHSARIELARRLSKPIYKLTPAKGHLRVPLRADAHLQDILAIMRHLEALVRGSVVGGYTLGEEIGRGASGVVFSAQAAGDENALVALKIMNASFATSREASARFLREARVSAALNHPGAVNVSDYGNDDGVHFLAMDILEGEPLRQRLAESELSIEESVAIGVQVAEVLEAAHAVELVHRDIKPENIFVLSSPVGDDPISVRVVDFGLAFLVEHDGSLGRLTQEGILGGTPAYMSPEQAQGESLTAATDVYSLGCVLYELACGETPFVGSVPETLARHIYVTATPLDSRELKRPVPDALATLIFEMLSKPESARPKPAEISARLRDL